MKDIERLEEILKNQMEETLKSLDELRKNLKETNDEEWVRRWKEDIEFTKGLYTGYSESLFYLRRIKESGTAK